MSAEISEASLDFVFLDPLSYQGTLAFAHIVSVRPKWYRTTSDLAIPLGKAFERVSCRIDGCPVWIEAGILYIPAGWEFDGASGPAIDGVGNMLAALVHDALYLLRREGVSIFSFWMADGLYRDICKAQGEGGIRRWYHWTGLRGFGWLWRLGS